MKCKKCNKVEATFVAPDKWCDKCWADWWFDPEYHLKDMTEAGKIERLPDLYVERAFYDLGETADDSKILYHVMQNLSKGSVNPNNIRIKIAKYRAEVCNEKTDQK